MQNPSKHIPDTIDCASCHGAALWQFFGSTLGGQAAESRPDFYKPDGAWVSTAEMVSTGIGVTPQGTDINVHMFGWLGNTPNVMQRVVNDTAEGVAYANKNLSP